MKFRRKSCRRGIVFLLVAVMTVQNVLLSLAETERTDLFTETEEYAEATEIGSGQSGEESGSVPEPDSVCDPGEDGQTDDGCDEDMTDGGNETEAAAEETGTQLDGAGTLDGDYAYIKSFTIDHIEDGAGNFDTEDNIAHVKDASGSWQTVESPGNDASAGNGKVRTYDSIIYYLKYEADVHTRGDSVEQAKVFFRFILPYSREEAEWDLDNMGWMQNTGIEEEEIDGVRSQVLTGELLLVPTENTTNVIPGDGTWRAAVRVLQMHHGDTVTPTFEAWLDHNCTDGICPQHNMAEVQTLKTDDDDHRITVTCAPKYNVRLKTASSGNASPRGEYDFTTGNGDAMDRDAGKVEGRIASFGITLQLYNDRTDKGLMGLEFPGGNIEFDLDLTSSYTPGGGETVDVTDEFEPLVWGWGPQADSAEDEGGRDLTVHEIPAYAVNAAPFNEGGEAVTGDGSANCKNGGSWSAEKDGNTVHFTVSGYEIDPKCFPNTDAGAATRTEDTYYDPTISGYEGYKGFRNVGCFSGGKIYIVIPFTDRNGKSAEEKYPGSGTGNFILHIEDRSLQADGTGSDAGLGNQMNQEDDQCNVSLPVGTKEGTFSQYILWSSRNRISTYDVFDGTTYRYNGQDWTLEGSGIAVTWSPVNGENGELLNRMIAARSLMKFDPEGVELTGEIKKQFTGTSHKVRTLFAAKKEKNTSWADDEEMKQTVMEDLVYYETLSELETDGKICIGVLFEVDPATDPEKVRRATAWASAFVRAREGSARPETYMCTAESRVWRLSQYQENPELTVPSLLGNDPDDPVRLPQPAGEMTPARVPALAGYEKTGYYPGGGYKEGYSGTYNYGDSLLVLETKATIRKQTMQTNDKKEPKDKYDLDRFERTADYGLYPRLVNITDPNGEETVSAEPAVETVTVQDILPRGLRYIPGSSYYGGTYTENTEKGRQGTVTGGRQIDPDIGFDPVLGTETLTWVIENVTVAGDMLPIYFSAAIGSPNDPDTDVRDGDRLMNTARIRVTGDLRGFSIGNGNLTQKEIMVNRLTRSSLAKIPDEKFVEAEAEGLIGYRLVENNLSSSRVEGIVLDTLPYDGDAFGSEFTGTYTLEEFTVNRNTDDISGWKVYYTTDTSARGTVSGEYRKEDMESGISVLENGKTVTWTPAELKADGTVPGLKGITPVAVATVCAISGTKRFEAHLVLKKDLCADERFVNTVSWGNLMTTAEVSVISRMLEGCLWIDADRNGARETAEDLPQGVRVTLLELNAEGTYEPVLLNGEPLTCAPGKTVDLSSGKVTDGEAGHYMFTRLPAGTFAVRFEGTALRFSSYEPTEKEKEGVSEYFNSNADGYFKDGVLEYTQIDGIVMKTKQQILDEGITSVQASLHNDSGLCPLRGGLTVSKTVKPAGTHPETAFSFTVTLEDTSVNGVFGGMSFADGVARFTLKNGESVTAEGLPAGTGYTVTEADYSGLGYTASFNGAVGVIPGGRNAEAVCTNTYTAGPVSVQFSGTKTFTGFPAGAAGPEFAITLSEGGRVIDTASVKTGAYEFKKITYTEPGVHTYTVRETAGGLAGIIYDTKTYSLTVIVMDNKAGRLTAAVSGDSTTGTDLDFTNRYAAEPVSVQFSGMKTLTGRKLADQEFSFTLTGREDRVSETVKNGADGKIGFTAVRYTEPGVYTYTVKEETAAETGITYDSRVYSLTVTVTDDGNGKLAAAVSGDSTTGTDLDFTNRYKGSDGPDEPDRPVNRIPGTRQTGSLAITKAVRGDLSDQTREFTFKVELSEAGRYSYTGSAAGTVANGETVRLKHGDRITVSGLPAGTEYKVTEVDSGDYAVYSTGSTGTIAAGTVSAADFINVKGSVPKTGDSSGFRWWLAFTGFCLFGLAGTVICGKRRRENRTHSEQS